MPLKFADWKPEYSVDDAKMDQQHKSVLDTINSLYVGLGESRSLEGFKEALDFLTRYTETHFADEEALLSRVDYPHLEQHKKFHQQFIARTYEIQRDFLAGNQDERAELLKFLKVWWMTHITVQDAKYVACLRAKRK